MIVLPLFFNNYIIEIVGEFSNSRREQVSTQSFQSIYITEVLDLSESFLRNKITLGITFLNEDVLVEQRV